MFTTSFHPPPQQVLQNFTFGTRIQSRLVLLAVHSNCSEAVYLAARTHNQPSFADRNFVKYHTVPPIRYYLNLSAIEETVLYSRSSESIGKKEKKIKRTLYKF